MVKIEELTEQLSQLTKHNFERMAELETIERDLMMDNKDTYNKIEELISKYNSMLEIRRGLNREIVKEQDTISNIRGENLFGYYNNRYKRFGEFNTDKEILLGLREEKQEGN